MAKKAAKKKAPVKEKVLSIEEKQKTYTGDLLRGEYDEEHLKRNGLWDRTIKRKARYWCFKIRHAIVEGKKMPNPPKGFKKFIEDLPGFAGWEYFAVSWDLEGYNPFMIVLRLQSVWQEWDAVMERVSIPIDTPPQQINERIQKLEEDYKKSTQK